MRISRRGATEGESDFQETDSKEPEQYIQQWKNDQYWSALGGRAGSIIFKVTKKEEPQRSSVVELTISDDDVCALFNAFLERMAEEENRLRRALMAIRNLIVDYSQAQQRPPASDPLWKINDITWEALKGQQETARSSCCRNWNPFRHD